MAVIGGGVAGAAACISLSRAGHRPLWLAPSAQRRGDAFGEALSPTAGTILEQLGLRALLDGSAHRRSHAFFSAWGGCLVERQSLFDLSSAGWVLDRPRFEDDLRRIAAENAECQDISLLRAEARADGWNLLLSDGCEISAGFVIDATGRAARLGRQLSTFHRFDRLVAATKTLRQVDLSVQPTRATLVEAVTGGWWYASLLPNGGMSIAYFSDPDIVPRGISSDLASWRELIGNTKYLGRWLEEAGFGVEDPPVLVSAGTTYLDQSGGSLEERAGWAAVGDAAAAFDPLSSHGLTTALWTGTRAGLVATEWLAGRRAARDDYAAAIRSGFTSYMRQRGTYYAAEQRFPDSRFWARRRISHHSSCASVMTSRADLPLMGEEGQASAAQVS